MDRLIPILNQLQTVLGVLCAPSISLPQIVVVGSQSSGKSSVLENIVGRDFLPRGNNIVTRRPLVLQLQTTAEPQQSSASSQPSSPLQAGDHDKNQLNPTTLANHTVNPDGSVNEQIFHEWGEFEHCPGKFYDFQQIKAEIVAETDRLVSKNTVSANPIFLRIFSPNVPNLTLVDLPGLTKIATFDQPADIEAQIRQMVLQFISNTNSIIVAVSSSTEDIVNSAALQIAREVDPTGQRTLGVLTKIDLMDQGTDVLHVIQNRAVPLKLGYIGVINRGQKDILENKLIEHSLLDEQAFFENSPAYRHIASKMGTSYLTQRLSSLLLQWLQERLPTVKIQLTKAIQDAQQELQSYSHPLGSVGSELIENGQYAASHFDSATLDGVGSIPQAHLGPILLELISNYTSSVISSLDGRAMHSVQDLTTSQLYGGARISFVFYEMFGREIESIDPFTMLSDDEIRTAIRNATGPRNSLFLPELAFDLLVKQQIERLRAPSLICIDLVLEELLRVAVQVQTDQVPHLAGFPVLGERLLDTMRQFLQNCLPAARQTVQTIINIELAYINTTHPDFIGGSRALSVLRRQKELQQQQQQAILNENGSNIAGISPPEGIPTENNGIRSLQPQSGLFNDHNLLQDQFGANTTNAVAYYCQQPPNEREQSEIDVIKILIASYFSIVKKTIRDTVPKAIMHTLVNKTMQGVQSAFIRELYHEDQFETLLREADGLQDRRAACVKVLQIMRRSLEIIGRMKDANIAQ